MNGSASSRDLLEDARAAAARQEFARADALYGQLLEQGPVGARIESLRYFAMRAFRAGALDRAVDFSRRVTELEPGVSAHWLNLGVACQEAADLPAARAAFAEALRRDARNHTAALCIGEVLEATGDRTGAAMAYWRAIVDAQARGAWRNNETTPPALRPRVVHAMDFVDVERPRLLQQVLAPLLEAYGEDEMRRIRAALRIYLGQDMPRYPDPRQKPGFLYVPDLPTAAFLPLDVFPWIGELQARTAAIRDEMLAAVAAREGLQPFHDREQLNQLVAGASDEGSWDALFFYRHGERFDANCARCPVTTAAMERLPRVAIRDHGPEILFSLLRPGAHILPHRGVTNARVVAHLPLVVPPGCALHVLGEEPHAWREGEVMVFDDTFEHEAWNRSGELRVILLMDTWNPWLSEAERLACTRLVEGIGDFRLGGERIAERSRSDELFL
jgi:aspartate beta-hydroxylase